MTNQLGTISYGVFTTILTHSQPILRSRKRGELVIESITIFFLKPVQMESVIEVKPRILEAGKFGKMEVEVSSQSGIVSKAMLMVQLMERRDAPGSLCIHYAWSLSASFAWMGS